MSTNAYWSNCTKSSYDNLLALDLVSSTTPPRIPSNFTFFLAAIMVGPNLRASLHRPNPNPTAKTALNHEIIPFEWLSDRVTTHPLL